MKFSKVQFRLGFSMIEMLIVIGIFGILSLAVARFQRDTFVFNNVFRAQLNSVDEGRKILRPFVGEVRSASTPHTGAYSIERAEETEFIFYSDIDNDTLVERVRYFLEDGTFKKGIVEPSGSPLTYDLGEEKISWVIQNVANGMQPIFEYYDETYEGTLPALSQPVPIGQIRLVKITVVIDHDPMQPPEPVELSTQVMIRNLKDNL